MKRRRWYHDWVFGRPFILLLVVIAFVGQPMAKGEMNPLLEEMAALDSAFKTIIGAVILGDLEVINPALSKVRDAREGLEGAVKTGYQISLPKNQNRLGDFFKLDSQFHIDLEELSGAVETGQKKVIRNLAHKLLDECVGCHERFRK
jgi:hypothetical protein